MITVDNAPIGIAFGSRSAWVANNLDGTVPGTTFSTNSSEFCDKRIDALGKRALAEQETSPDAASAAWHRVDKKIVDAAPWVPLVNPRVVDVVSKRVGNYQYSPAGLGVLIDQLWVR